MSGDRLLRGVVRAERGRVGAATLGCISHQTCETLVPVLIGVVVDQAIEPSDGDALLLWIPLLALLFVVLSASFRMQLTLGERAQQRAEHDLRLALTRRVLDPGGVVLSGMPSGALVNVAGDDARQAVRIVDAAVVLAGALAALAIAVVVLLGISVPLGLLALVGTPLLVALLHRIAHALRNRSAAEQARAADASAVATDLVRGSRVLKGIGAEAVASDRYRQASRASLRATLRAAVAENALEGANVVIGGALLAVVAFVGGRLALEGTITVGELIAAVGLTQFLIGPLQRIGFAMGLLAQARASADRVAAVLAAPHVVAGRRPGGPPPAALGENGGPPRPDDGQADVPASALQLSGLRCDSRAGDGALDLDVAPGEHLGLVAPDPGEAIALLDVLARRREPVDGAVRLDGVPLPEVPLWGDQRCLLVSDHDADLFEGSLADNVTALAPDLAGPALDAVLSACAADQAVAALPGGLDAPVGERGRMLSGGQRQRIALARALAAQAPVLVLHDPTTAVDSVTEARIATGLRQARAGATTLLVASSPGLLAACHRVVLMRDWTIVAEGTHDELAERDDRYREAVLG